jgi:chromosome segregation ATPase
MIFTDKAAREKIASLESRIGELEADIIAKDEAIEAHAGELSAKDQTIAEHVATISNLTEKVSNLETEAKAKDETISAHAGKITELETAVTEAQGSAATVATEMLASIGQPEPLPIEATATATENTITLEAFNQLTPIQRNEYIRKGGKLKN